MKNQYQIVVFHTHQYTEGITGQNRSTIISKNKYSRKGDCKIEMRELKKKYKTIITRETPYGNIGHYYTFKILSQKEIETLT